MTLSKPASVAEIASFDISSSKKCIGQHGAQTHDTENTEIMKSNPPGFTIHTQAMDQSDASLVVTR
jgi:hypothetical protein